MNCSQPCRFFVPPHCQLTQTPPDRGVQPMHSTAPQGAREVGLGRHAGFPRHLVESFFTNPAWSRGATHTAVTWGAQEIGLCHHAGYCCAATSTCHLHKPRLITGPGPGIPVHPTVSGKLVCVARRFWCHIFEPIPQTPPEHGNWSMDPSAPQSVQEIGLRHARFRCRVL